MVDNDTIKNLGSDVQRFDRRVGSINLQDDAYRNKQEFEDLENMYKKLCSKLDECDNDKIHHLLQIKNHCLVN